MREKTKERRRGALACMLLLAVIFALPGNSCRVYAAEGERAGDVAVIDDAALFTESEIEALNEGIAALEQETGWNVYAVTTEDAVGKTARDYADDFFNAHSPEQEDGVAMLIDMDNREIVISTGGEAIRYLTDERIEWILDAAYTDISNGYYGDCMITMLEGVTDFYYEGIESGQHNYNTETGEKSVYRSIRPMEAAIALAAALGCGILFYVFVTGKYRLHFGAYQYEFRENGHVSLRTKEDRFTNQTVTHRRIPKQTSGGGSSSGRSSTHRSSSGRSHGGGSRKF